METIMFLLFHFFGMFVSPCAPLPGEGEIQPVGDEHTRAEIEAMNDFLDERRVLREQAARQALEDEEVND